MSSSYAYLALINERRLRKEKNEFHRDKQMSFRGGVGVWNRVGCTRRWWLFYYIQYFSGNFGGYSCYFGGHL